MLHGSRFAALVLTGWLLVGTAQAADRHITVTIGETPVSFQLPSGWTVSKGDPTVLKSRYVTIRMEGSMAFTPSALEKGITAHAAHPKLRCGPIERSDGAAQVTCKDGFGGEDNLAIFLLDKGGPKKMARFLDIRITTYKQATAAERAGIDRFMGSLTTKQTSTAAPAAKRTDDDACTPRDKLSAAEKRRERRWFYALMSTGERPFVVKPPMLPLRCGLYRPRPGESRKATEARIGERLKPRKMPSSAKIESRATGNGFEHTVSLNGVVIQKRTLTVSGPTVTLSMDTWCHAGDRTARPLKVWRCATHTWTMKDGAIVDLKRKNLDR